MEKGLYVTPHPLLRHTSLFYGKVFNEPPELRLSALRSKAAPLHSLVNRHQVVIHVSGSYMDNDFLLR